MPKYIDVETIPALFNEEFKETQKLIEAGETQLDNLAEGFTEADEVVRSVPPADVQEVRHGKWDEIRDSDGYLETWIHRDCGRMSMAKENYCPNCGAKMDLEEKANGDK